jgi:ABC-type metal ion transport system substrate-binding protein
MTPENFITFLTSELKKKLNLTDADAQYLTETLLDGYKKVINGQYAILYKPIASNTSNENQNQSFRY